jgi:hypothetical protein
MSDTLKTDFEAAFWDMYPGASGHGEISEVKDDMELALFGLKFGLERAAELCPIEIVIGGASVKAISQEQLRNLAGGL